MIAFFAFVFAISANESGKLQLKSLDESYYESVTHSEVPSDLPQIHLEVEAKWLATAETQRLRDDFTARIDELAVDEDYRSWAEKEIVQKMRQCSDRTDQYVVFADRNPQCQRIGVGYYFAVFEKVFFIGWDKCSTGNPAHGRDYHFTPCGIFENTLECFSFRAAGTKNANGWRGYGKKNSRVWDFGYQETTKPIKGQDQKRQIRLLMHATDPDGGEPLLGTPQSKGCVRISAKLNEFMDRYGLIDANYEAEKFRPSVKWLFLKDRQEVEHPGRFLIIGDSK